MTDLSQSDGPDPLDMALGRNIRVRRKSLGLSQSALGAAVGLTFQQIQKYESGANRVSFSKLMEISKALTCRVSNLIENAEDGQPSAVIQDEGELVATTGALELLQHFARIRAPHLRQALIKVARTLSGPDAPEPESSPPSLAARLSAKGVRTRWRRRL